MKGVVITVAVLACLLGAAYQAEASCNVMTTARIIGKLCLGSFGANQRNQTLIDGFYGCYKQVSTGEQQFVDCQTRAFGSPMNTVEAVQKTCANPLNVGTYTSCLREEFTKAGLDMDSTVQKINSCQAGVMGIRYLFCPQ